VAKVPEGVASIVQHSHRTGQQAFLTNQYVNDYARAEHMEEEKTYLPLLMNELPSLLQEFTRKMGEPLNADGSRKSVIIMVSAINANLRYLSSFLSISVAKIGKIFLLFWLSG
jgi:hypothetical protein